MGNNFKKNSHKNSKLILFLTVFRAAFFHGQVEQPVRGLMSLMQQKDLPVLIAINEKGVFVVDQIENVSVL